MAVLYRFGKHGERSGTQKLGSPRLFLSTRGGGRRRGESREFFIGLVLVNYLLQQLIQILLVLQLTQSTIKWTIEEVRGSKETSKKPQKSMSHKATSGKTPSNLAILPSRAYVT